MDLGYFHADDHGVDITAFPMTLLLALRAPLFPTLDRPGGRLQPYAMAGASFYITDISVRLDGMGGSSFQSSWPWPTTYKDPVVGPYLAAGLAWQPTRSLAIFGEYRHTGFDVDFDTTNSLFFPTANGRVDTTIRSDRILFGISHRFGANAPGKETNR
jgi:opacity protein-like surface antigen